MFALTIRMPRYLGMLWTPTCHRYAKSVVQMARATRTISDKYVVPQAKATALRCVLH